MSPPRILKRVVAEIGSPVASGQVQQWIGGREEKSRIVSRVLVIQHVAPEGPAVLGDALRAVGCAVDIAHINLGSRPIDLCGYDGLVVLGGPMSATSDEGFPTRQAEVELLRRALDEYLPTLGICLGAQLLASAGGGRVWRGSGLEIGWGTVTLTSQAVSDPLFARIQSPLTVFHWHGDTFDLPPGAVRLAGSVAYRNQAFRLGPVAWGLQFHVEVDEAAVESLVVGLSDDAERADGGGAGVRQATRSALNRLRPTQDLILSRFARLVLDHAKTAMRSGSPSRAFVGTTRPSSG